MSLRIDALGIQICFEIKGYRKRNPQEEWDPRWCECDYSFCAGNWLSFHRSNDEVLLADEVEDLAEWLTKLLDGEIGQPQTLRFAEPDFIFRLVPIHDLRKENPNAGHSPKPRIVDIHVDWEIYFWCDGLTANHLSIRLFRKEITQLRDYINSVIT